MSETDRPRTWLLGLTCLFFAHAAAWAGGDFAVSPLRVDLAPAERSAAVTVTNDGKEKLNFQLEAKEWTQDEQGNDRYTSAPDLVFFPRILSVEPGQEGTIRLGVKSPSVSTERSFRLFIEELPGAPKPKSQPGMQVDVLVRFGLPIFSAPLQPKDGLAIESLELKQRRATILARNTGNRRQVVRGLHLRGKDAAGQQVYSLDIADRYILAGLLKSYSTVLTPTQCQQITSLTVEIKTDRLSDMRALTVSPGMCS
jgi:fimbrial chaperone protein